jgi:hypothetical protein
MTRDFEHCLTPSDFTLLLNAIPVLSKRGAFHLKEYDQIAPLHARMMEVARRHRKLFQFAPNDEEDDTVQNGRVSVAHASDNTEYTDDDEDDEGHSSSDSSVDSDIEVRWEADKTVREEAMEPPPQPAPTSSKHHAHSHTRSSERSEEKNKHGRDRERRTKRD